MALSKDEVAMDLAKSHLETEPEITAIYWLLSDREDDPDEPLKLLEVNPNTIERGIEPIRFGPDASGGVPFPVVVVDVSPGEFAQVRAGDLKLPNGWSLGPQLECERTHAS